MSKGSVYEQSGIGGADNQANAVRLFYLAEDSSEGKSRNEEGAVPTETESGPQGEKKSGSGSKKVGIAVPTETESGPQGGN